MYKRQELYNVFIRAIGCSFRPGQGTVLIFYDSPVPVHTGSRLTDPGYSVPGEVHAFPEYCRSPRYSDFFLCFLCLFFLAFLY